MGQCNSCPEDACKLPNEQQQKHLCQAAGLQPRWCTPVNIPASCGPAASCEGPVACNTHCRGPQNLDSVDLGRAAPVSFRSPQSLKNLEKGFMINSGSSGKRGPHDWEEEVVAPETIWRAARHADATYSPRWAGWPYGRGYVDYSSPCQVKSTLNALADSTWVLSNSPATPQVGPSNVKDLSECTANSSHLSSVALNSSVQLSPLPQFGTNQKKPQGTFGGKENLTPPVSSKRRKERSCGKENEIPDLDFFKDPSMSPVSTICSKSSMGSLQKKPTPMVLLSNNMSVNRASIRNSHIGRGL